MIAFATLALGLFSTWFATKLYPPTPEIDLSESEEFISYVACVCPPEIAEPAQYTPLHIPRLKNTRLAFPGEALNEEPSTKGFEDGWLALYKTKTGYEMRKTRVKISRYRDKTADWAGGKSGRRYTTSDGSKPLFMTKGIPGLKPGEVGVDYNVLGNPEESDNEIFINSRVELAGLSGTNYALDVENDHQMNEKLKDDEELLFKDSGNIVFYRSSIRQILYSPPRVVLKDVTPEMRRLRTASQEASKSWILESGRSKFFFDQYSFVWSGDIDGDRRLDIMLRLGHSFSGNFINHYVLYISSQAREGELVAPVAAFESYAVD